MKECSKCNQNKPLDEYYKHPLTSDGRMAKCKDCAKEYARSGNRTEKRKCSVCTTKFYTNKTEVKRGGGKFCSRACWYKHFRETVPTEHKSWAWKGGNVGKGGLHNWVQKHKGKPRKCEHCHTTKAKQYDWANISQEYKRDVNDFKRLCRSCHAKFDYPTRSTKWREAVKKRGWLTVDTLIEHNDKTMTVGEWAIFLKKSLKTTTGMFRRLNKKPS